MRKSFVVAVGVLLAACGGGADENKGPATPTTPVATATATTAPTAEAPKKEEPKQAQLSPAEAQKKTMMEFGAAMNAHDAKKVAALYTDNAVMKMAGMPDLTGREAIQGHFQKMFDAMPNGKGADTRVWMKGDVAIGEWAMTGTHTGEFMGIKGTEKPVGMMGADVIWFTPEGQIKEQHSYMDMGTIMSQIGVSKHKARAVPTLPTTPPQVFTSTAAADEQKNVDAATKMMGAFEKKSEADFIGAVADDITWDDMTQPETMKGKDSGKKYFKMMTTAFPDGKITSSNVWGIGDYVIVENTMTGTQKGALGPIAATKKPVTLHGIDIMQFKDGKIVKGWSYGNSGEMMMQLGLMPQPGAAKADVKKGDMKKGDAPKTDAKKPAAPKK
jgi:steroid delta-isomerase-like uncharacterized protein